MATLSNRPPSGPMPCILTWVVRNEAVLASFTGWCFFTGKATIAKHLYI